ncbi:peptidoglycan recognition protein family protein [Faecalimicrobium sp. JNUCC 81]
MEIKQNLVNPNKYSIKCPYTMNPEYVTFHNTDNDAPAKNEVSYMINNNNQVSFHVAVDDLEAIQGIPFDRNTWNAGDGNGTGNRKSISVEICYNKLGANNIKFKKAEENAVKICAQLLKQFNLGIDKLKPHKYWSGKNCPSTTNHQEFINRVDKELKSMTQTKKYKNCILYGNDIDKVAAEILSWSKEDCIVKNVKNHIPWEGYNLFVVGGPAKIELEKMKTEEKYTTIAGNDRYDTVRKCLEFIEK